MKDWDKGEIEENIDQELREGLSAARAWLQVLPAKDESQQSPLQVGEPALLMVKATLPGKRSIIRGLIRKYSYHI